VRTHPSVDVASEGGHGVRTPARTLLSGEPVIQQIADGLVGPRLPGPGEHLTNHRVEVDLRLPLGAEAALRVLLALAGSRVSRSIPVRRPRTWAVGNKILRPTLMDRTGKESFRSAWYTVHGETPSNSATSSTVIVALGVAGVELLDIEDQSLEARSWARRNRPHRV